MRLIRPTRLPNLFSNPDFGKFWHPQYPQMFTNFESWRLSDPHDCQTFSQTRVFSKFWPPPAITKILVHILRLIYLTRKSKLFKNLGFSKSSPRDNQYTSPYFASYLLHTKIKPFRKPGFQNFVPHPR